MRSAAAIAAAVVAFSLAIIWIDGGNHPIYPPDEARYGVVSMGMADGGSWLVPRLHGEPHLTKPPLTYWAQAAALRAFGHGEWALRAPSMLAATLTSLLVLWVGVRFFSRRTGVIAVALLSMMPLSLVVAQLANTDAMLGLYWFGALACGWCAVETGRARWAALMWVSVALGLLTKGPFALAPVGVLLLWLALGGRFREARRLHALIGLPVALAPVVVWGLLIMRLDPAAIEIWKHQTVERAMGRGDHTEPIWWYVPVFLGGLFPATAMLTLPWVNIPWRTAVARLRAGDGPALLVLAVIAPFIMFSLVAGKLVTYLLPLCAPLALLVAAMLDNRLRAGVAERPTGERPPDVVITLTVTVSVATVAALVGGGMYAGREAVWAVAPFVIVPFACALAWAVWRRSPGRRAGALVGVWAAWMVACLWGYHLQHTARAATDPGAIVALARGLTSSARPTIITFGVPSDEIAFYCREEPEALVTNGDDDARLRAVAGAAEPGVVVLADPGKWKSLADRAPEIAGAFAAVGRWRRWVSQETLVLRPAGALAPIAGTEAVPPAAPGAVSAGSGGDGP